MLDRLFVSDLSKRMQVPKHCRKVVYFSVADVLGCVWDRCELDVGSATFAIFEYGEVGARVLRSWPTGLVSLLLRWNKRSSQVE